MAIRTLVISNSAMNHQDSNGRTILNLVDGIHKDSVAQFFTYGNPDTYFNCYKVSDFDAKKSFLKHKVINGTVPKDKSNGSNQKGVKAKIKKTPFKMLIREFVWKHGFWNNVFLEEWIDSFDPQCVLLVLGDNCFLPDLAISIVKKRRIPLYIFSTEDYPFKKYNYITKRPSIFYCFFRRKLLNSYKSLEKYVNHAFFNTDSLRLLYEKQFKFPCSTIYNATSIDWNNNAKNTKNIRISYLGNLGLGRHKALIDIARVLNLIAPGIKLDVYGNIPNDVIKSEMLSCEFINLKGFVDYNKVIEIIHGSTVVIHAETDDCFYLRDLKYAFSTKIADCVSSGTPLFLYAPHELAESIFLIEHKCAFVATSKSDIKETLFNAIYNQKARTKVLQNALIVRNSIFTNNNVFAKIAEEMGKNENRSN